MTTTVSTMRQGPWLGVGGEPSVVSSMAAAASGASRAAGARMERLSLIPRHILERTAQAGKSSG